MSRLIGVVAMTKDRVIGNRGDLPWHLPEDLKFFKRTTLNSSIVMGRKTFDSIGKPLPKRHNIVITRDKAWSHPDVSVIHDSSSLCNLRTSDQMFIIGGGEIYELFMPLMDELLITHVNGEYEGDAFFPKYSNLFPNSKILNQNVDFTIKSHTRD